MATMLDSHRGNDHWYVVRVKPQKEGSTAPWRWECLPLIVSFEEICKCGPGSAATSTLSPSDHFIQTDLPTARRCSSTAGLGGWPGPPVDCPPQPSPAALIRAIHGNVVGGPVVGGIRPSSNTNVVSPVAERSFCRGRDVRCGGTDVTRPNRCKTAVFW
jgi:hypothetical protein